MRLAILHRIAGVIGRSRHFTSDDFDIRHEIAAGGHTLIISCRAAPECRLVATAAHGAFDGTIAPGQIAATEHFRAATPDALLDIVRAWLQATHHRLAAGARSEYFTHREAAELAVRLDAVHRHVEQRLRRLGLQDARLAARLDEVQADVAVLKRTIPVVKKRQWLRSLMRRCGLWVRDTNNRAIVKDVVEIARRLLVGGPHVL